MRVTAVLLWLGLVLWFAAAVLPGAAAISAFTVLPRMGATSAEAQAFFGADTKGSAQYLAGHVLQPLFTATDWVQISAGALSVSMVLRLWRLGGMPGPHLARVATVLLVVGAGALLAIRLAQANPMMADLATYWAAILAVDHAAADAAKQSFDAAHHTAERLSSAQVTALLAAVIAAALATTSRPANADPNAI